MCVSSSSTCELVNIAVSYQSSCQYLYVSGIELGAFLWLNYAPHMRFVVSSVWSIESFLVMEDV